MGNILKERLAEARQGKLGERVIRNPQDVADRRNAESTRADIEWYVDGGEVKLRDRKSAELGVSNVV
jgi:hypothetical protein